MRLQFQFKSKIIGRLGLLMLYFAFQNTVADSRVVLSFGVTGLYMRPVSDSSVSGFKLKLPGKYYRVSIENYIDPETFIHNDLNLSFIRGSSKYGIFRSSRLNFNYGIGKKYGRIKLAFNPGFCFVSSIYQDNRNGETIAENRFSPSAGLQFDYAIVNSGTRFFSVFTELNFMIHKPLKWVNQLAAGLSWKPVFVRKKKKPVSPF